MNRMLALLLILALAMPAQAADPPNSIYHLELELSNQRGEQHGLDVYRGHPVLIALFYADCAASCPLIIATLQATERALPAAQRARLRVLLVSIDSDHDTPQHLRTVADARHIDTTRWTLAHANAADVRQLAAVLNVQYRRLPNGQYNHSNQIALLTPRGEIATTSSVIGRADAALLTAITAQCRASP